MPVIRQHECGRRATSIQERAGFVFGTLTVLASNTTLVISQLSKIDMKALSNALRVRITSGSLPPLPPLEAVDDENVTRDEDDSDSLREFAGPESGAVLEQLKRLSELNEAGVLSDAEFTVAKAGYSGACEGGNASDTCQFNSHCPACAVNSGRRYLASFRRRSAASAGARLRPALRTLTAFPEL